MIAARQELDLRPQLERLDRLICWSEDIDEGALSFAFRPLWQLDEPAKAALALSRAQATQVYAGLKLWPDAVMARLAEAQLVADGTYPNAAAVFAEAEAADTSPTLDYDPNQPRDVGGRWTAGGAGRGREAGVHPLLGMWQTGTATAGGVAGPSYTGAQTQSAEGPADLAHESPQERLTAILGSPENDPAKIHLALQEHVVKGQVAPTLGSPRLVAAALAFLAYRALQSGLGGAARNLSSWFQAAPPADPKGSGPPPSEPHDEPPPPTIHGEAGSAALPVFSPAPPEPGLPPSVAVPPARQAALPGASAPAPDAPFSLSQQAEDPKEKAQQEKLRQELERSFDNIKQHITDDDAFAAWEESRGNHLWTKGDGTPYKHDKEVQSAQNGWKDIILRAKGLLGRPRLLPSEAGPLQDLLGRASRALDRTEDYLPRGGQETGDGWVLIPPQAHDLRTFPR